MHDKYNRFRAELRFNPIYDELFGVQVNKSNIEIKSIVEQILHNKISEFFGGLAGRRKTVASKFEDLMKQPYESITNNFKSVTRTRSSASIAKKAKSNESGADKDKDHHKYDEKYKEHTDDDSTEYEFESTEEDKFKIPESTEDEHRNNFNKRVNDIKAREFIQFFIRLIYLT